MMYKNIANTLHKTALLQLPISCKTKLPNLRLQVHVQDITQRLNTEIDLS